MADHVRSGIVGAGFIGDFPAGRAVAAGKHVICEKPPGAGVDSSRRLATPAALAPVTAVPFVCRFYPTVRDVAEFTTGHRAAMVSQASPGRKNRLWFSLGGAAGEPPDGLPTFDDGLRAAVLTDAVLSSARSGGWVDVPAPSGGTTT